MTAEDMYKRAIDVVAGWRGFAAEMREKNIHVGMGSPPVCVTCGQAWPCESSKLSGGDAVRKAIRDRNA